MASGVALWLGPVSASTLRAAIPGSWRLVTHNIGDGSDAFRAWAMGLGADPLTALGVRDEPCLMAGFSRAHGAHEVILQACVARRDTRLRAFFACDAYYVARQNKSPKPGHLAWLRWILAADDKRRALFTTSTFDGATYASASASIAPLAHALELAPSSPLAVPFGPGQTELWSRPERAFERGAVTWLDFGREYKHTEHATLLAPRYVRASFGASRDAPPAARATSGGASNLPVLALLGVLARE